MAGSETRPAVVEIDGKPYTLELTINGIVALEELLSTDERMVTFDAVVQRVNAGSVKHMRAFFWAALREHHKDVTLEGAGRLIQAVGGLEGLATQFESLARSTSPDPEDVKALGADKDRPLKARAKRNGGSGGVYTSMHGASV
jgi:hypothetical protein